VGQSFCGFSWHTRASARCSLCCDADFQSTRWIDERVENFFHVLLLLPRALVHFPRMTSRASDARTTPRRRCGLEKKVDLDAQPAFRGSLGQEFCQTEKNILRVCDSPATRFNTCDRNMRRSDEMFRALHDN
jgi:hypothetical protein